MDQNQEQEQQNPTNKVSVDDFFDAMVENMLTLKKNYKQLVAINNAMANRIKELESNDQ